MITKEVASVINEVIEQKEKLGLTKLYDSDVYTIVQKCKERNIEVSEKDIYTFFDSCAEIDEVAEYEKARKASEEYGSHCFFRCEEKDGNATIAYCKYRYEKSKNIEDMYGCPCNPECPYFTDKDAVFKAVVDAVDRKIRKNEEGEQT